MEYQKGAVAAVLRQLDLGASVAEEDDLLEFARVETSVFTDLLNDRVDLVPGSKGSGKSALYRIFVDFLAPAMLKQRKVVVAHGVQSHGDSVFLAFKEQFERLTEDEFVDFWCIYLVSLAHEQFVKSATYEPYLAGLGAEVAAFRDACAAARIPEVEARKSLRYILEWALAALQRLKPRASITTPDQIKVELGLFGDVPSSPPTQADEGADAPLPRYIDRVKETLDELLQQADLTLWLMVDRLDEIFPRRSALETRALRGLLRTLRIFNSKHIRVKVFLRDDILEQVTADPAGFTALTHITARQAHTLGWSEGDILTLVVKRLFASTDLCQLVGVNPDDLTESRAVREAAFYRVFPATVHSPPNQSPTLRWLYSHTMDARGVVTPRDVIDLLTKAKQQQQDEYQADPTGPTEAVIGSQAIRYGLTEMSRRKRDTVLRAELPHLAQFIEKFEGGKTEYTQRALYQLLGPGAAAAANDLVKIGLLSQSRQKDGSNTYKIPFLYRDGLNLTQGRVE